MKRLLQIIFIGFSITTFGQNGISFEIENLSKPQKTLYLQSYEDIYKNLILNDVQLNKWDLKQNGIDFKYNILAKSQAPDSLVNYGYNSFFYGMYQAYAEHRPFVLSPDMIWLLISQGFARHVNANPEKLREYFGDSSGKLTLVVNSDNDLLKDSTHWETIFPQFTSQIAEHAGKELINTLTSNFSTTTEIEKIASEITILEATEPYFEYVVMYVVCGIPEITLQGTTEDWQKILDKTKKLSKYDLKWWTDELEPILNEFVNASKGDIDKDFWRNMFKYHSQTKYGAPKIIDGWIVKFFPYDKDGKRNNLDKLIGGGSLPEEIVKVDLKYLKTDGVRTKETMLELWAGFIGLEQNPKTYALTPKISWMIKKKDIDQIGILQKLESENIPVKGGHGGDGIDIKIVNVPENLKQLKEIYSLKLHFKKDVVIPEWLKNIRIGMLDVEGEITESETNKIIDWFPNTDIKINGKEYNKGKNGWVLVSGNKIPDEVLELKKIWILEIWNMEDKENKLIIPDALKNIKIDNLTLVNNTSPDNIELLKKLLPQTNIYIQRKKINSVR
jgi:hypothetical protein